jgi:hypothetical protein
MSEATSAYDEKMDRLEALHDEAMDLAGHAYIARRRGAYEEAARLAEEAFTLERAVADGLADHLDMEPSRAVLHRSAASLAIQCGRFDDAHRLAARGLAGRPDGAIADELRLHQGLATSVAGLVDELKRIPGRFAMLEPLDTSLAKGEAGAAAVRLVRTLYDLATKEIEGTSSPHERLPAITSAVNALFDSLVEVPEATLVVLVKGGRAGVAKRMSDDGVPEVSVRYLITAGRLPWEAARETPDTDASAP